MPSNPTLILSPSSPYSTSSSLSFSSFDTNSTLTLSPVSTVSNVTYKPYSTTITTDYTMPVTLYSLPNTLYTVDVNTGLNDNYLAQKQMTKHFLHKVLDKWLYKDDMCHLLKYFVVEDGKVSMVQSKEEAKKNKLCNDSTKDIELKADYIEDHYLDEHEMKKILLKIISETNIKWYELPTKESVVIDVVERILNKKFKNIILKRED